MSQIRLHITWMNFFDSFETGRDILECFKSPNATDWGTGLGEIRNLKRSPPDDMPQENDNLKDRLDELIFHIASSNLFIEKCPDRALLELGKLAVSRCDGSKTDTLGARALAAICEKMPPMINAKNYPTMRDNMHGLLDNSSGELLATVTMVALDKKDVLNATLDTDTLRFWRQLIEKNIKSPQYQRSLKDQTGLLKQMTAVYRDYAVAMEKSESSREVESVVGYGGMQMHEATVQQLQTERSYLHPYGRDGLIQCWQILINAERTVLDRVIDGSLSTEPTPSPAKETRPTPSALSPDRRPSPS